MRVHYTTLVIASLAAIALVIVAGGIALAFVGRDVPRELVAIGASAAGSIGSLLARAGSPADRTNGNGHGKPNGGPR